MIGIIGFNSLKYMQFLYIYKDILDDIGVEYEVIFWNREGDEMPPQDNFLGFNETVDTFLPFYKKILAFIKYVSFVKRQIKSRKYDKLIILTSQTAVPISWLLFKKYKKKYIFDYRDITYERFTPYLWLIKKLAKHSSFTAVSSEKFLDTINTTDARFVVSHNCSKLRSEYVKKTSADKIRIVYWGMVRQLSFVKRICDVFANDERIELFFHGKGYGADELESYISQNRYNNIHFTGVYTRDRLKTFAENTDILLNTYENDILQKPAMTVKLYDAIRYGLPMLVTKGSYMAQFSEEYGLGLSVDFADTKLPDKVIGWYRQLKLDELRDNCSKAMVRIQHDNKVFVDSVIKFVDGEKR